MAAPTPLKQQLVIWRPKLGETDFAFGSNVTVPAGFEGLALIDRTACDLLKPGEYVLDERRFPKFVQKLRLSPGNPIPKSNKIGLLLMNVDSSTISWSSSKIEIMDGPRSLNYCAMSGSCLLRIADPILFYKSFQRGWPKYLRFSSSVRKQMANASFETKCEVLVRFTILNAVKLRLFKDKDAAKKMISSHDEIVTEARFATTRSLESIGIECLKLEMSGRPYVWRPPCEECGSQTALTGYGVYRRVIGLWHFHLLNQKSGNFCVPCAAKLSVGSNLIMLVAGWWSIWSFFLTPVFLIQNCYYFLATAFGSKQMATDLSDDHDDE